MDTLARNEGDGSARKAAHHLRGPPQNVFGFFHVVLPNVFLLRLSSPYTAAILPLDSHDTFYRLLYNSAAVADSLIPPSPP